jgi:hypothetical protein
MPIPFLFIAAGVGTAALGIGKGVKAGADMKDAHDTNETAQDIVDRATNAARISRENCSKALEDLGLKKIWILNNSVDSFIRTFEQLHNVELEESAGLDELKNFHIDKQSFAELKQMSVTAASIAGGLAGSAAAGALTALGAYGGAMTLGTCATTGTAIATLSGAAATNATLAFLGGGALSIGGLGVAGGTMVLGGLVAGPALAVMGFIAGAKASASKDAAYSNLAKANKYKEEVETVRCLCKAIRMRANMFERLLIKLDAIFEPLTESLAQIIQTSGTDFSQYTKEEKAVVAENLAVVKAIKAVLDTPILTEDGNLTEESNALIAPVQSIVDTYANS